MDNNALFINVGRGTIVDGSAHQCTQRSINQTCLFRCFEKDHLVRTILYMI